MRKQPDPLLCAVYVSIGVIIGAIIFLTFMKMFVL